MNNNTPKPKPAEWRFESEWTRSQPVDRTGQTEFVIPPLSEAPAEASPKPAKLPAGE